MISKTVVKAKSMFHSETIQGGLINVIFWFRRKIVEMKTKKEGYVFLLFKCVKLSSYIYRLPNY